MFHIFAILSDIWLNSDSYILTCFFIGSVVICFLIEEYEESLVSFRCVLEKRRVFLIALSDNCGYLL